MSYLQQPLPSQSSSKQNDGDSVVSPLLVITIVAYCWLMLDNWLHVYLLFMHLETIQAR